MKFSKGILFGSYDAKYGILYLYYKGKNYSYGKEIQDGLVVLRSIETDEVVGYLIYDFKEKVEKGELDLEQFDLVFKVTLKELAKEIQNGSIISW